VEEAETVEAGLRQIEFLDTDIEQVERLICQEALKSRQIRRLLTVPAVNVICAAVFLAAVGDIRRFNGSRPVVAYLGLDPRVYQSGSGKARSGRISKQGSPQARWALAEAAQSVAQQPGRCTPSMSASGPAAATTSRSSPSRASSPCCSTACSPARRTTHTSSPR
jgi:transposase